MWSAVALAAAVPTIASAQDPAPAAAAAPSPADVPAIRVGATIFTNYTYQSTPEVADSDGNMIHRSAFDVTRAYININGTINHAVAFRITPDLARENDPASSLSGSLEFRLKYAYLQVNLDDWLPAGSYVRFGIQQTPYLDYTENIYQFRFEGTMFAERTGYFASADAGASFHLNFPGNYGDVHVGYFNGENYNKTELNDQKALMIRATARPFANRSPILRGLRTTVFYDGDHNVANADRKRTIGQVTFEHKLGTVGVEYLDAHDQVSALPGSVDRHGTGYSVWATPKGPGRWEELIRYDHQTPDNRSVFAPASTSPDLTTAFDSQKQNRVIVGLSYWFPHQGNVSSALMVDYDGQTFKNISTPPVHSVGVHALINF